MQKDSIRYKKTRIIVPMILSLLLLASFILYWLDSQYQQERGVLREEIHRLYSVSINDASNRLVYKRILEPIINYPDTSEIEKLQIADVKIYEHFKKRFYKQVLEYYYDNKVYFDSLFTLYKTDQLLPDVEASSQSRMGYFSGFYSIIYQNRIDPRSYGYLSPQNTKDEETIAFSRDVFERMLNKEYPGLKVLWTENDTISDNEANKKIYLITFWKNGKSVTYAVIENYVLYLLKLIFPQIAFVFVLFSLSVFALVFAYRGYLSQIKLNVLRSDFVNNITHELKIPVATAKAALEAMQGFGMKDEEKMEKYHQMMLVEMNRLDKLTSRVLEHSKLQSRQHPVHKAMINMNEFIRNIVESVKLAYPNLNHISYDTPLQEIHLSVDKVYIEGVIRNLIENSMKYGGEDVKIEVVLWQENEKVFISVLDDGPGIPEEYISKIFDRFFRVPTGNKHNIKGFGLGLSFAALVMKQHDGSIKARNLPDKGCEFILRFPYA